MKINVTNSFLPPRDEFDRLVDSIWKSGHLTNNGPLLKEFEVKIRNYLDVDNFQFVSNGTIALQLAIEGLGIRDGEIITTPFSYVATTSAILWQRCKPIFVDIDSDTLCIDPAKIEAAITSETKAILAVHVFGNPCDIEVIEGIAKKHNLKVIYDAAHAFGVKYKGKSILSYGDVSIVSFHATKLFHTIEGGGIVSRSKKTHENIYLIKLFGHIGDDHYVLGINGKASEFQAAMGLANMPYIDSIIQDRKRIVRLYDKLLGDAFKFQVVNESAEPNYSYYPIIFKDEKALLTAIDKLSEHDIFPRRYFFPSLNTLTYITDANKCPVSEDISRRILCLPLYPQLNRKSVQKICRLLV